MTDLWSLERRDGAVIVNVPHAGTRVPDDIAGRLAPEGTRQPDTDWHVQRLYEFVGNLDVTLMSATQSRIVVDLNRDPSGDTLYPGASNTEICPLTTFHQQEIYQPGCAPDDSEVAARVARYWQPYHRQLAAEIDRIRQRHGYCILLDGHSIVSVAPRFFAGRLPDFNLGTADGASCEPALDAGAFAVLSAAPGFSAVHNGRFKGGAITRRFGRPAQNVHALQLEMAQCAYLDESRPEEYDSVRAAPLVRVLQQLLGVLLHWRPQAGPAAG